MKKLKKIFLSSSIIATLALSSINALAHNYVPDCTGVHHLSNKSTSGMGYENVIVQVHCPSGWDNHNRMKVHFYNRTSEPVKVMTLGGEMIVESWSENSFEVDVDREYLTISIRGLNDNSNQILNGELSVKSWAN